MRWIIIILLTTIKFKPQVPSPVFHNDFVTVAASYKYASPSLFEKIIFGSNYRKEWETPVTLPVFNIKKKNLRITAIGGGQQTTSLELLDDKNEEWRLRSVDKNVKPSENISKINFIRKIIQDHVSGAYPYGGLSYPDIAHAAGVPAGNQTLYFVPDDSSFGQYRSAMANKVFILFHQPNGGEDITTAEMLAKLDSCKGYFVDQQAYLKARLVDWLIADWDRHEDQWKWIERNTDSGIAFHVLPRDHDQAFFRSNGLLVRFLGLFFMQHIDKFNNQGSGIKELSKKTSERDIQFTNNLTKEDWERIIKDFQNNISDSVIEAAIKKQPKEIFAIRGNELIEKLKSRRDGMLKHVMKYYSFLSDNETFR